ncbi:unnamed protein product [Aspergillus oryzae]|nr:unnamed protein product [Aspergillus oryzae]
MTVLMALYGPDGACPKGVAHCREFGLGGCGYEKPAVVATMLQGNAERRLGTNGEKAGLKYRSGRNLSELPVSSQGLIDPSQREETKDKYSTLDVDSTLLLYMSPEGYIASLRYQEAIQQGMTIP